MIRNQRLLEMSIGEMNVCVLYLPDDLEILNCLQHCNRNMHYIDVLQISNHFQWQYLVNYTIDH